MTTSTGAGVEGARGGERTICSTLVSGALWCALSTSERAPRIQLVAECDWPISAHPGCLGRVNAVHCHVRARMHHKSRQVNSSIGPRECVTTHRRTPLRRVRTRYKYRAHHARLRALTPAYHRHSG